MKKKLLALSLCFSLLFSLCSCNSREKGVYKVNAVREGITKVEINALQETVTNMRVANAKEPIDDLINFLNDLVLLNVTEDNPNDYGGLYYVFTIYYKDGSTRVITLFANMYFKEGGKDSSSPWYQSDYEYSRQITQIINRFEERA